MSSTRRATPISGYSFVIHSLAKERGCSLQGTWWCNSFDNWLSWEWAWILQVIANLYFEEFCRLKPSVSCAGALTGWIIPVSFNWGFPSFPVQKRRTKSGTLFNYCPISRNPYVPAPLSWRWLQYFLHFLLVFLLHPFTNYGRTQKTTWHHALRPWKHCSLVVRHTPPSLSQPCECSYLSDSATNSVSSLWMQSGGSNIKGYFHRQPVLHSEFKTQIDRVLSPVEPWNSYAKYCRYIFFCKA